MKKKFGVKNRERASTERMVAHRLAAEKTNSSEITTLKEPNMLLGFL